jgi:hypothetical protein
MNVPVKIYGHLGSQGRTDSPLEFPLDYIRQHTRTKSLDQPCESDGWSVSVGDTENGGRRRLFLKLSWETHRSVRLLEDNQSQSICGKVPFTLHVHQATFYFACTGTTNHCTL